MSRFVAVAGLLLCFNTSALAQRSSSRARVRTHSVDSTSEEGHVSAAILVGYGVGFNSPDSYKFTAVTVTPPTGFNGAKPYGFSFGTRGGYTFPFHLYLGSSFVYQLGTSSDAVGGPNTNISGRMFTLLAEAGYEFEWDAVRLRPFLGLGIADVTFGTNNAQAIGFQDDSTSTVGLAIQPGVVFEYSFSGPAPGFFIGLDTHFGITTVSGSLGLVFLATGGYRF